MGNVLQTSKDAIYLARHVGLRSGMKQESPGLILNLLCGSGVKAVATAEMLIDANQAEVVLAGGTDSAFHDPLYELRECAGADVWAPAKCSTGLTFETRCRMHRWAKLPKILSTTSQNHS